MKRLKTILVDDEPRGLSSLQKLLEFNCPEVEIISFCNSASEAKEAIQKLQPQLVFLDIAMPGKNGIELLHDLKPMSFEIIFVTAHNNYMLQAFSFSAVDYLLKPVEDELLIEAVNRASKRIEDKTNRYQLDTFLYNMQQKGATQKMKLCIPSLKGFQVVNIRDIIYCEASSNYTYFHFTNQETVCASKSIYEYEELLQDCNIIRIHKSFLVNLEHVKEYIRGEGGTVLLTDKHEIEVSRRKKDFLMEKMKVYYKF